MPDDEYTGANRCWPCTIANVAVGLLVALVPPIAALVEGTAALLVGSVAWAVVAIAFTVYRVLKLGYLPFAEPVARATGVHERIGPGSNPTDDRKKDS